VILLIDNYDSFTYNLYQCVETLGFSCVVARNDSLNLNDIKKMAPEKIIISPGPGDPDSAGISLSIIKEFSDKIPILGVCLGHQAIGQAYGAKVIRAPKPKHGKIALIYHDGLGVYDGLSKPFEAARYHSLILEKASLPAELIVTSETKDGIIMGISHARFQVLGVQFHPESIATVEGEKIIANFLKMKRRVNH
jgi:anthranilate synthase/aminodeoxychorismate synthase-like glutamine amidotransferase